MTSTLRTLLGHRAQLFHLQGALYLGKHAKGYK